MKIYVASPLFSAEEKLVINQVAGVLHQRGFETYLPMEHGVPDAWSYTNAVWAQKMFTLDKEAIDECDAVLCIYYGMNSDSGTAWEVGYAYGTGKPVVVYHAYDTETEIGSLMICNGSAQNVDKIYNIPDAFNLKDVTTLPYQS